MNEQFKRLHPDKPFDCPKIRQAKLDEDVAAFLSKGGKIQKIAVNYHELEHAKASTYSPEVMPTKLTAEDIKAVRAKLRLTQSNFAHRIGLKKVSSVSGWETGRFSPGTKYTKRIKELMCAK